ncbi:MAG: glycoside hydrolase family 3 C-terminal domain-containing protein [Bacteroidales bacterium]|nr:beta-glucosidase [Bacteroidales bacterium]MBQ6690010.1 glycoside hydrolase family 3 C-terminal domain-containing protein [Bacteroidales bacterium]
MKLSRFLAVSAAVAAVTACVCRNGVEPAVPYDAELESRVEQVLKRMTLEEKVGQMTQITATAIANGLDITPAGDSIIRTYKVGSILNTPGDIAQSPEGYDRFIEELNRISMEEMGIPCLYGLDHIHGVTYVAGGVLFPQEINIAATFNRQHAFNMGKVTAYESRAANVPWTFSPTMDLGRNPEWPRMWESFGEDTYVNAQMAVAEVKGMQGDDPNHVGPYNIAACAKHFMGYGVPVTGQDRTPASIAASELREKHFEPFKEAMKAGALSIMVNSASNNGMPFHCNTELLTKWVKEDLCWDGMIVTDWADINNLYTRERVASSKKEAVKLAINAGIDMAMVPYECQFAIDLKELVEEGEVPMSRVDDAVRRVLRLKFRLGLFDTPDTYLADYPEFGGKAHAELAYRAAVESEVLLKNNGILPLKKDLRILLTGPNANSMRTLNGGWSYTWQGHGASKPEFTQKYNTIYEALSEKFDNLTYVPGVEYHLDGTDWQYDEDTGIKEAVRAARRSEVIIACIGENSYCETPGNDVDLSLSDNQIRLVKALAATGRPLILILNEGRPRIINEIEPLASAVVDVMLPGNYGGDALAALMCGEENFSGKLPFTYPKYTNKFAVYDYKPSENQAVMSGVYNYNAVMDVQWPFGHGLSYTDFEYSDLKVSSVEFGADDVLKVSVDVTNTGNVAGKESVLLFSSDLYASSTPDVRRLRAFEKVDLAPGQTATVEFELPAKDLAFVNYYGKWTLEAGDFILSVADQSQLVKCVETIVWEQPNI